MNYYAIIMSFIDCWRSLGMASSAIKDEQITASSFRATGLPKYGRLNRRIIGEGGWSPSVTRAGEYLQVDLLLNKTIFLVAAHRPFVGTLKWSDYYTTKYSLQYSFNGQQWQDCLEISGNKVSNYLYITVVIIISCLRMHIQKIIA